MVYKLQQCIRTVVVKKEREIFKIIATNLWRKKTSQKEITVVWLAFKERSDI